MTQDHDHRLGRCPACRYEFGWLHALRGRSVCCPRCAGRFDWDWADMVAILLAAVAGVIAYFALVAPDMVIAVLRDYREWFGAFGWPLHMIVTVTAAVGYARLVRRVRRSCFQWRTEAQGRARPAQQPIQAG